MSAQHDRLATLRLFVTLEHPCSYLPRRAARNLVVDPQAVDQPGYAELAKLGFRRSGSHVYRPHCNNCEACLSLRVPVSRFRPNRSQRRTWQKNSDLEVTRHTCHYHPDHYRLFERYLTFRHRNGGMDDTSPEHYLSFVSSDWSDTFFYEFRTEQRLLAIAVTDRLDNGLSAVYTFFDPREATRGLGTYAILYQIEAARSLGLDWLYLGYWIRHCDKMAYKAKFQPFEIFTAGRWLAAST